MEKKVKRLEDIRLKESYLNYNPDSDFNGSKGIAIANEIERRAGGLENVRLWIDHLNLSEKESKLLDFVKHADSYGVNPNKNASDISEEGLKLRYKLLHSIGIDGFYGKKKEGMKKAPKYSLEHAPKNQVLSAFNQYYVKGCKLKESLNQ